MADFGMTDGDTLMIAKHIHSGCYTKSQKDEAVKRIIEHDIFYRLNKDDLSGIIKYLATKGE